MYRNICGPWCSFNYTWCSKHKQHKYCKQECEEFPAFHDIFSFPFVFMIEFPKSQQRSTHDAYTKDCEQPCTHSSSSWNHRSQFVLNGKFIQRRCCYYCKLNWIFVNLVSCWRYHFN